MNTSLVTYSRTHAFSSGNENNNIENIESSHLLVCAALVLVVQKKQRGDGADRKVELPKISKTRRGTAAHTASRGARTTQNANKGNKTCDAPFPGCW